MNRPHWRKPLALAAAATLVVAGCGSDGENAADTVASSSVAPASTGSAASGSASAPSTSSAPSTQATVPTASGTAGEVGLIDGVYRGEGDFTVDPADCPADWDPMQGITDTDITFFTSMPRSGPLSGSGLVADGIQSYFEHLNELGGIDGRQLHLVVKDDGYQPDKTKTNVDEALESGSYAALVAILGTPTNLAVWDATNDECMPQLFNGSGAPQWGDVTNHPWTTGSTLDYASEAGLWVQWLQAEHPEASTVAAVAFNNDFGKIYVDGFKRFSKGTNLNVIEQQYHEPTAVDLSNQFTTMAASHADVVLIETTGAFCTQAMAELDRRKATWQPIVIMSASCGVPSQFFQPLIDQGLTGEGVHVIQYSKDANDPAWADDEFVKLFRETAAKQGLDTKQSQYANGWFFAYFIEDILREAATYQGGLDRGNILLAARQIDVKNPVVLDGITQRMSGIHDAYLIEGGRMVVYQVQDPSQLGSFVPSGELLDNDGALGTYQDFTTGG